MRLRYELSCVMSRSSRNRRAWSLGIIFFMLGLGAVAPQAAVANHHFVKISEVFAGTSAEPTREFVELMLYANGQNVFAPNSRLEFYNPSGVEIGEVPVGSVANGSSQRTTLVGTSLNAVAPDTVYAPASSDGLVAQAGGAVCFESTSFSRVDCVSWGAVTAPPTGSGTPAPAMTDTASLTRSIAPGCSSLLEGGDDTNNSAADFFLAPPSPQNNSTPASATCMEPPPPVAPETTINRAPKPRTTKRRSTFEFSSSQAGSAFLCSYDGAPFAACASPQVKRLSVGTHSFAVKAVVDGLEDPSPARHTWKIKRKRRR